MKRCIGKILYIRAAVGLYLPNWRPGCDYRQTVTSCKDLGGGVICELSHELDYVRWLVGEVAQICALSAAGGRGKAVFLHDSSSGMTTMFLVDKNHTVVQFMDFNGAIELQ